jgi:hypothetical protein
MACRNDNMVRLPDDISEVVWSTIDDWSEVEIRILTTDDDDDDDAVDDGSFSMSTVTSSSFSSSSSLLSTSMVASPPRMRTVNANTFERRCRCVSVPLLHPTDRVFDNDDDGANDDDDNDDDDAASMIDSIVKQHSRNNNILWWWCRDRFCFRLLTPWREITDWEEREGISIPCGQG